MTAVAIATAAFCALPAVAAAAPGDAVLASRADGLAGVGANNNSFRSVISANGSVIVFESLATNLTADPATAFQQIYSRNLVTGTTVLLSKNNAGTPANQPAQAPSVSDDGLVTAFQTAAGLDPADTDGQNDIYVRDLRTGTTELISRPGGAGTDANGASTQPAISADGNAVAFVSNATNLGVTNLSAGIFVRNRAAGTVTLASRAPGLAGAEGDGASTQPAISADGRFVAFASQSTNLSAEDSDFGFNVHRRDLQTGETVLVSRATGLSGAAAQSGTDSTAPSISADGRFVAFDSAAANLDPAITPSPGTRWIFVRDVAAGTTTLVSRDTGVTGAIVDGLFPAISADGGTVVFRNTASTITRVRNVAAATTVFIGNTSLARIAPGGGFLSLQSNLPLASGENPAFFDVFRYELPGATPPPGDGGTPPPPGGGGTNPPSVTRSAGVVGAPIVGTRVTCGARVANATTLRFSWRRGTKVVATTAAYRIRLADLGKRLRCVLTATGPGGTVTTTSPIRLIPSRCVVPATRGLTVARARSILAVRGCRSRVVRVAGTGVAVGRVLGTNLRRGSSIANGGTVTLRVRR